MTKKPKKPIEHVYNGEARRGAHCRERVYVMLGDLRIWVSCGWPKSAHPRRVAAQEARQR